MSRGPELEQIVGGDPTFRVAIERADGERETVDDLELMPHHDAHAAAIAVSLTVNRSHYSAVCVVNERTGIATDRISWAKPGNVIVSCPDCGLVEVKPDVYSSGKAVSGECDVCGDRLYFE